MVKEYNAEYTILIDGSVWGKEDYSFYAEDIAQAKAMAEEYQNEYIEIRNGKTKELLLDYVYDDNGEIIS